MSWTTWGVQLYGVCDAKLDFKSTEELLEVDSIKEYLDDLNCEIDLDDPDDEIELNEFLTEKVFDGCNETAVDVNGKKIFIDTEYIEDDKCSRVYGFYAGYPWCKNFKYVTKEDVQEALWILFGKYVRETKEEFVAKVEEINTYNCG